MELKLKTLDFSTLSMLTQIPVSNCLAHRANQENSNSLEQIHKHLHHCYLEYFCQSKLCFFFSTKLPYFSEQRKPHVSLTRQFVIQQLVSSAYYVFTSCGALEDREFNKALLICLDCSAWTGTPLITPQLLSRLFEHFPPEAPQEFLKRTGGG